jgi:uridylate kinase
MDLTAVTLAMERKIPLVVFNLKTPGTSSASCAASAWEQ